MQQDQNVFWTKEMQSWPQTSNVNLQSKMSVQSISSNKMTFPSKLSCITNMEHGISIRMSDEPHAFCITLSTATNILMTPGLAHVRSGIDRNHAHGSN